jgi:hypothetical protein
MTRNVFVLASVLLACGGCGARHNYRTDTKAPAGAALLAASPAAAPAQASPLAMLQPDAFDAPAPVAAAEAERVGRVLADLHHMDHGSYVHLDAGRAQAAPPSPRPSASPAHRHHR